MENAEEIIKMLMAIKDDLNERHSENITRLNVTERKVDEAIRRIDDLHNAFPDGDWDGHRRDHEAAIRKAIARAQLYETLKEEITKKGLWAVIVFIGLAVWQYIKSKSIL